MLANFEAGIGDQSADANPAVLHAANPGCLMESFGSRFLRIADTDFRMLGFSPYREPLFTVPAHRVPYAG